MISYSEVVSPILVALAVWLCLRFFLAKSPLSNIPGPRNASLISGNFKQLLNPNSWGFHRELRDAYGGGGVRKLHGLLGSEQLYVFDPLALHHILVKDQSVFDETQAFLVNNKVIFGNSLLSSFGEEHRKQRKMLNPVFSTKHMREMLPMLYPIAYALRERVANDVRSATGYVDVMGWMSRAALEYIGQGGLGHSFASLDEKKKIDPYSDALKMAFPLLLRTAFLREFTPWLVRFGSPGLRRRILEMIPASLVKDLVSVADTLEESSEDILRKKRQAIEKGDEAVLTQVGKGKDIMSILRKPKKMSLKNSPVDSAHIPVKYSTFILAGHDTTTNAISRIIDCLAHNQDYQSRLREELTEAYQKQGELDYDALQALPVLDAVCRETLRVHCPALMINRVATKDVILPLMWPIKAKDGKSEIREIFVPKGTEVYASILNANTSKEIWGDDADQWKPSRWLNPLPESVANAKLPGVYSQMMTFAGGSRACIGFKFSEMEMKMVLSVLIRNFVFEPGPAVRWEFGLIAMPFLESSTDGAPKLPLKVSFAN
ncbi:cytochrome P450 [Fomitiporia mediterranea MF3/22]|uniref:cytochrome P450 n=1 Tax=Fomitiporia mediterranea (strain MF3/22) TaxID=694068 RepID=UPI0004407BC4|nr:cytochrome P450 [Fomitiporia mediterranea MF3/22]EJC99782.1 cytochrome P450 [Fomitiporia mediterranea MF3/22]